jgi:hypothetical protein|tara:strand:- start:113 stop:385 length:273 start_codon:yes stop_codon:yes gene_type:complete
VKKVRKNDSGVVKIFIKPYSENKYACGVDDSFKADTPEKEMAYIVALGLKQISIDDPDLVYGLGKQIFDLENQQQENKIIELAEWRKKLN